MSILEIQNAIQELSPAEVIELGTWLKTQLPWYEREPHKSRIEAARIRLDARAFEETDLDEFERRVLGQTLAEFEASELQRA
jgi:hypothetical protein